MLEEVLGNFDCVVILVDFISKTHWKYKHNFDALADKIKDARKFAARTDITDDFGDILKTFENARSKICCCFE